MKQPVANGIAKRLERAQAMKRAEDGNLIFQMMDFELKKKRPGSGALLLTKIFPQP
jgi:hypothetical protein